MKDLLQLLGKRVHDLRTAKKWSQEEFAHISGLHRTYVGQVERGEKNLSFANLIKIAGALGVNVADLLAGLEDGRPANTDTKNRAGSASGRSMDPEIRMLKLQRLVKRLINQRGELDRTISAIEESMFGRFDRNKAIRPRLK